MGEKPNEKDRAESHHWFAVQANNRTWELSEKTVLTEAERSEILDTAHAASYHWSHVGGESQVAHARLLLGRVHALLGNGPLAMDFATQALTFFAQRESEPWEMAFAHAIVADAGAASGDAGVHRRHYEEAREWGDRLTDPQEKAMFLATFNLVPAPRSGGGSDA